MQRRPLILAAVALPSLALPFLARAQAPARLPLRNLLVELRHGEASQLRSSGGGVESGAVVVGPNGEVRARGGVTVEARGRDDARGSTQQVTVLNGGQASLRVGLAVPMQWLQWGWTPDGPVLVGGGQYVETGSGFVVQPRWTGGDEPVTVELRTEGSARASAGVPSRYAPDGQPLPDGAVRQAGVLTTVQVRLGEWITVASSGDTQALRKRGLLSTRDIEREQRLLLQMRVTAP